MHKKSIFIIVLMLCVFAFYGKMHIGKGEVSLFKELVATNRGRALTMSQDQDSDPNESEGNSESQDQDQSPDSDSSEGKGVSDIEENFGMDGYSVESTEDGGTHHTAYSSDEGSAHFSWDTDKDGNVSNAHETLHDN